LASEGLRANADKRKVWELADGGWRTVLAAHRSEVEKRWVSNWNTPKAKNVDELFQELLGVGAISQSWYWAGMSATKSKNKLDKYVTIRGQIAHRVQHTQKVYKSWSTDYLAFVEKLVEKTDEAVKAHLQTQVGQAPW
jgi:ElaB/YqjD/DUF883 family membrane-anchored ribosome-binding protein